MKDRAGQRSTKLEVPTKQTTSNYAVLFGSFVCIWLNQENILYTEQKRPNVLFIDTRTKSLVVKTNGTV